MKVLIVGVGVSDINNGDYGQIDMINSYHLKKRLEKKYDNIVYFKYQEILDHGSMFGEKFLDPLRWKLKFKERRQILNKFETIVKEYQEQGYEVDLIAHSLFCWISSNAKTHLKTVIHCGSPVGFITPVARMLVRNDIAMFGWTRPNLRCDRFINLYSTNWDEPIGHRPNIPDHPKWAYGAIDRAEFNTYRSHDFKDYLNYIYNYNLL
jgi:hypothetical protein